MSFEFLPGLSDASDYDPESASTSLMDTIGRGHHLEVEVPFFEKAVKKFGWHLTIKAALEALGIMPRFDRMPLLPLLLDSASATEVQNVLKELPIDELAKQPDE